MLPGAPIEFVYFPEDALVGLLHPDGPKGLEVPVALVGNDGLVGVSPFLRAPAERLRAQVLHPGSAWRLPVATLNHAASPDESCLRVVLGYLQALNAQIAQAALCRLQHTVYQRLCHWLQGAFDRVPGTVLHIDPAELVVWLGAEPDALAQATTRLVAEGAVANPQGQITLLDREQLDRLARGCHPQLKPQTRPLFPHTA